MNIKGSDIDLIIGILFVLVLGGAFFALASRNQVPGAQKDPKITLTDTPLENSDNDSSESLDQSEQNLQKKETNMNNQFEIPQYDKPSLNLNEGSDYSAIIKTNKGNILIDLYEKETPITVNNFVYLSEQGFYNQTKSHRIIKDFMVQFGDPFTKNDSLKNLWGSGDPGYKFNDEPFEGKYERGIVAMANSGPNTNGSQFFIMHQTTPLPPNYVIFGRVKDDASLKVLDSIANTPVTSSRSGESSSPTQDVVINEIVIEEASN